MYQILKRNKEKTIYFTLFTLFITCLFLLLVVVKNGEKIRDNKKNIYFQHSDLISIKKFLLAKIESPFINVNYEIKSGDSIQKILKKFKIENNEIQNIINQYKKYSNPNQLFTNNKIDIVLEENVSKKGNSIIKFSVPITKSTTIEITKNEQGKIISKKLLLNFTKKEFLPKM